MKHVVFFSGGLTSYATAWYVVKTYGVENCRLLFTDTLIEDDDLYRFLIEVVHHLSHHTGKPEYYFDLLKDLPPVWQPEKRKEYLSMVRCSVSASYPLIAWIAEGRNPWEVFRDEKFLGNSRVDPCSRVLKRELSRKWVDANYQPGEVKLYLGIDEAESHRFYKAVPHWTPYELLAPLVTDYPIYFDALAFMLASNIKRPKLYDMGFPHNNCGGFCVKTGQRQMTLLNEQLPEIYEYHADEEQKTFEHIGSKHPFIRVSRNKTLNYLSMKEYKRMLETGLLPSEDIYEAGCGCFLG